MSKFFFYCGKVLDLFLHVIFQTSCLCCDKISPETLCSSCNRQEWITKPLCDRCGNMLASEMLECGKCAIEKPSTRRVRSLLWLNTTERKIIHQIKFQGWFELLGLFKPFILEGFTPFFPENTVILPVPIHHQKYFSRGFNQSEILACWIAKKLKLNYMTNALLKIKATTPQSHLSRLKRVTNLTDSIIWNQKQKVPSSALLIDDIYTTGSTLEACAKTLLQVGCNEVYGWTLLRTKLNYVP